ncbi:MAG: homoserine dehydrogenase [Myxococcales bacterium]|nr:homoserine dehydrogenase [Myxococcales bacterium]
MTSTSNFKIAILGAGTVGGGVARILLEQSEALGGRAARTLELAGIVDLFPAKCAASHGIDRSLFCGDGDELTPAQAKAETDRLLADPEIDLVVETIGGSGDFIVGLTRSVLESGKHLVTANKALLAKHGQGLFKAAAENRKSIGFEAAVCGAIPIIKGIHECFTGDEIISISGIFNGTSNYIMSKMEAEGQDFATALAAAQEKGYAEADPSLDINGGDAGHKLTILLRMVFGLDLAFDDLEVAGIEAIDSDDVGFADEMHGTVKLICYGERRGDDVFAAVGPAIVKRSNLLSKIDGATNAVRLQNRYSDENVLIGQGAGSLETGSAIVSDIVFIARYGDAALRPPHRSSCKLRPLRELELPCNIVFETADMPGITGIVCTALGRQNINIDTVSHNRHMRDNALFAIATMPCTMAQVQAAVRSIQGEHPNVLLSEPRVMPILV